MQGIKRAARETSGGDRRRSCFSWILQTQGNPGVLRRFVDALRRPDRRGGLKTPQGDSDEVRPKICDPIHGRPTSGAEAELQLLSAVAHTHKSLMFARRGHLASLVKHRNTERRTGAALAFSTVAN